VKAIVRSEVLEVIVVRESVLSEQKRVGRGEEIVKERERGGEWRTDGEEEV
jgi:hypothetical protein